jgi:hypothetical protein
MPQPLTCASLAAAVVAHPAPLVFLDSAAVLDVLRVPFRRDSQVDVIDSAVAIVNDAESEPRRVWSVTTANVVQEIETHRESVRQELIGHIKALDVSIDRALTAARSAFPERQFTWTGLANVQLDGRILRIMDGLVESTVVYRGSAECVARARDRVWAGAPPASRVKQEFKDCEIFEEFLELVSAIRREGFESPIVFVTPNSRDYGPPPSGHPRIASDLAPIHAQYAASLSWARALIRS